MNVLLFHLSSEFLFPAMLNIPFINKPPVHSAFLSPHSLQFASAYFGVFCALAFAICLFWLVLQARALCSWKGVSGTRNSQNEGSGKGISKKKNFWHGFPNFFGWAEHFGGPEPTPTLLGAILVVGSTLWYQVAGSAWLLGSRGVEILNFNLKKIQIFFPKKGKK